MERRQYVQTKWRKSTSLLYKLQKSMMSKKRKSLSVETPDDFQRRILQALNQRTAENAELKKRIAILEKRQALPSKRNSKQNQDPKVHRLRPIFLLPLIVLVILVIMKLLFLILFLKLWYATYHR